MLGFLLESVSEKELWVNIGGTGGSFEDWADSPYFDGFFRKTLGGGDDFLPVGVVLGDDLRDRKSVLPILECFFKS